MRGKTVEENQKVKAMYRGVKTLLIRELGLERIGRKNKTLQKLKKRGDTQGIRKEAGNGGP